MSSDLENELQNFRELFQKTPEMVVILRGPDHIFEFVNEAHVRALGFNATGKTVREAQPESVEVHGILDKVYQTGVTAELVEIPITLTGRLRYFNLTYSARRGRDGKVDGVMILGIEVTEQVLARRILEESETRFRKLSDIIPALVWTASPNGSITYYNQNWYDYTGLSDEALGWGWTKTIHPDDVEHSQLIWKNALKTGESLTFEHRVRRYDGEYRWHLVNAVAIRNKYDQIIEWFGTLTDVNAQKLARLEFERMVDQVPAKLWLTEKDGHCIYLSRRWYEYTSQTREESMGFGWRNVIHPEDREKAIQLYSESAAKQVPFHMQFRVLTKSGEYHWAMYTGNPRFDQRGHFLGYAGTIIDIHRQKQAEAEARRKIEESKEQLKLAKEEAEHANRLKSAFLANMSHEIRTPLGAMIGFTDLLRDPNISEAERLNYTNILARNAEQLSVVINDILDLSKVEAGHLTLEHIEMHPRQIAENAIALLQVKAAEKGITLKYVPHPSTPAEIISDPNRVHQVLLNLISNAVKFTPKGSVTLRSYGSHSQLCFEIEDTGIGISPSQQERIFEMFVQADGSVTRRFGGTGLGLALSRRLARSLGGDVSVLRSEEGRGTTFLFKVADQPYRKESPTSRASESVEKAVGDLNGVRVLVVDDSPDNQELISTYLERKNAIVHTADNGLEGYNLALTNSFDMVLMDIQMPIMDGYTATQKLREAGYEKPIIALTAHAMTEIRKKCLNVGCTDHLTKPINPDELWTTVARHAVNN